MEPDYQPDPWDAILDLLQQLPEGDRHTLADALRQVLRPSGGATGTADVVAEAQTAEAYGTVLPAVVRAEPGTLTLLPVAATAIPGELTVTLEPRPDYSESELRRRQDRWLGVIIVTAVLYTGLVVTSQPLPEAVRDLLGQAIEVLLFGYPRK